jgi:hypothetical protein
MSEFSQIEELIKECGDMEIDTNLKANRLKILNIIITLTIIIGGSIIGVISALGDSIYKYWITLFLGFLISLTKILSSVFRFETKAIANMQITIKMRQFIRKLRKLQRKNLSLKQIDEALDRLGKELDDLKISIFTDGSMKRVNSMIRRTPRSTPETSVETQTIELDV